jgi:hypothetical protein
MVLKVHEVVYLVLEFREKKETFTKVEGGNIDFIFLRNCHPLLTHYRITNIIRWIGTKHVYPEP